MDWTDEIYRLDKVADLFGLPCVVRLENSFLSPEQAGKIAQGDVITLDSEISFDKVASNFIHWNFEDHGVLTQDDQEIFLPHSYYGKLRVLKKLTTVYTVKELANIFPGKAELGEKITIITNEDESVTLAKGTDIELERVIPGFICGLEKEPDELVIHFQHSKRNKVAAIPFDMKRKFHTKADPKIYTIQKAITRYGLPLEVKFLNDEIRQKFQQEVLVGRRMSGSVTTTLRLNRIVRQRVIVGHHIPAVDCHRSSIVRRKTVIAIPIESKDVGRTAVNVCEGDALTIYKSLVDDMSAIDAYYIVADSLSLDFAVMSELKLFPSDRSRVVHRESRISYNPGPTEDEDENGYLMPTKDIRRNELDGYIDMTGTSRKNAAAHVPPLPPRRPIHPN